MCMCVSENQMSRSDGYIASHILGHIKTKKKKKKKKVMQPTTTFKKKPHTHNWIIAHNDNPQSKIGHIWTVTSWIAHRWMEEGDSFFSDTFLNFGAVGLDAQKVDIIDGGEAEQIVRSRIHVHRRQIRFETIEYLWGCSDGSNKQQTTTNASACHNYLIQPCSI